MAPSARRSPIATLEYRDDHRVGHPDAADEQRDGTESEEETGEGLVGGVLRGEGVRGPATFTSSGAAG